MYVNQSSVNWLGTNQPIGVGWYPDPLVPFINPATGRPPTGGLYQAVPFSLAAGNNQPIWVDITVPRTAGAGQYNGSITVISSGGNVVVPVSLTVWNFALPLKPSQPSSFAFWQYPKIQPGWNQLLLQHRLMPLIVSNCQVQFGTGLVGGGCAADSASELNLMNTLGLSMADLRFWTGAQYGNCIAPAPPSVADIQRAMATHQSSLVPYNYSFDEITNCPNLPSMIPVIQQWARNLHAAGVLNYINMGPSNAALFNDGTGRSAVDIWGVLPVIYNSYPAGIAQALQMGNQIWSYSTLVQDSYSPKWQIDFAPINFRIQPGFINANLGITGLFSWRTDLWLGSNPWILANNVGVWSPTNNYPGEGMLVYPADQVGIPGGIVPSMRLKWIRDGMDDYDYVAILKGLGQGPWALSLANSVGPDWTNWTRNINSLYSVRTQLGTKISQLMSGPSGPANVSVTPSSGSALSQTFQFLFSDSGGASQLSGVNALIAGSFDGRNACWVYYSPGSNQISLASDSTATWSGANIGSNINLSNSQCTINAAASSVAISGNNLTLNLAVTFQSSFAGSKTVYMNAIELSGPTTGYQPEGSWIVP